FGTNCTNGAAFVVGDTAIFQPGHMVGQAVRQAVKYAIYEPCNAEPCPNQTTVGQYDIFRYPTMKKWQDEARPDFNNLDGGRDVDGEFTRWLDLARTGLWHRSVDDNWQASPSHGGFFNDAKHHLRPIPQTQIDLTAGGTRAFPQNPGY